MVASKVEKVKNEKPANIFIISGPSGAGEDAIIDGLKKKIKFNTVITTVTRKKRKNEKQGRPYYFITEKKFKKLLQEKKFIEWAYVYGCYRGCTFSEIKRLKKIGRPIIWKVDWKGVKTIKKIFPEAVAIFITVPSYQTLIKRLEKRGLDSKTTIKTREKYTKNWFKQKKLYDIAVVNKDGKLNEAISKVESIIKNHKIKASN